MSTFNKLLLITLATFIIAACQSTPKPVPAPAPETMVVPEPVDLNLQSYEKALSELKAGNTDLAIDLMENVIAVGPTYQYIFTNLGLAHFKQQNYDQAEQAFLLALESDDSDAIAYNHLGIIKRIQGKFDHAKQSYVKAIAFDPGYAIAYLNLGVLYDIYFQDLELALRQYKKYQILIGTSNETVARWIIDIQRRIKSKQAKSQG